MKQLNNFTDDEKDELNFSNCKYRDTDYFKNVTKDFKRTELSFFFIWIFAHLLKTYFNDFNILLSELNFSFDMLAIKESQIKKYLSSPVNLQLNN